MNFVAFFCCPDVKSSKGEKLNFVKVHGICITMPLPQITCFMFTFTYKVQSARIRIISESHTSEWKCSLTILEGKAGFRFKIK